MGLIYFEKPMNEVPDVMEEVGKHPYFSLILWLESEKAVLNCYL